jgi:hypothetical protein
MRSKLIITIFLLTAAITASFALPKHKYTSPDILSKLQIPMSTANWRGKDISDQLNAKDLRYSFISRIFAREYVNRYGQNLTFLILETSITLKSVMAAQALNQRICLKQFLALTAGHSKRQVSFLKKAMKAKYFSTGFALINGR